MVELTLKGTSIHRGERVNRTDLLLLLLPLCLRPRDREYTKLIVSMRGNKTRARHYRPSFGHWKRVKAWCRAEAARSTSKRRSTIAGHARGATAWYIVTRCSFHVPFDLSLSLFLRPFRSISSSLPLTPHHFSLHPILLSHSPHHIDIHIRSLLVSFLPSVLSSSPSHLLEERHERSRGHNFSAPST